MTDVIGGSAGAMTGEFGLNVAPTFSFDKVLLSVVVKGGYTLNTLVGAVTDEEKVTFGGFWLGLDFCVGLVFNNKNKS